ncbi:MAG: N-acetylmuramoyl-L-alanine amidase [Bdellovibrionales bacterium]
MKTLTRSIAVGTLVFSVSGCGSNPAPEHLSPMESHMFMNPDLRSSAKIKPLLKKDAVNEHAPDLSRLSKGSIRGLRIALDPGHMGGGDWDERTGKYVFNSKNERLSEGQLALQLALLLEKEFKAQGAEVFLTRRTLDKVTSLDFADFTQEPDLFVKRFDLDARAEKIWSFHPDITLILHFDSNLMHDPAKLKDLNMDHAETLCNNTKTFVSGAFEDDEFSNPEDRSFFKIIWRNPEIWNDSVALSESIVQQIQSQLGVPLETREREHTRMVSPGVFARNLYLQRKMAGHLTSFVEALCYEDAKQFQALLKHDHSMKIAGQQVFYSQRLVEVAHAIGDGVVDFIRKRQAAKNLGSL